MDRPTDGRIGRRSGEWTGKLTDRGTDGWTDRGQAGRLGRQEDKQTDGRVDRQRDICKDRRTDGRIDDRWTVRSQIIFTHTHFQLLSVMHKQKIMKHDLKHKLHL